MRYLKVLVIPLLTGLILSCTSKKQEQGKDYSGEIDSLLTELRILDDSLNTLNIQKVQRINESFKKFYDTAQVRDTQARKFRLYEDSQNILKWYGNLNREINYIRSHLRAMKKEFKGEDITETTKQRRLSEEREIVESIKQRFNQEYESLKQEVKALLNRQSIHE